MAAGPDPAPAPAKKKARDFVPPASPYSYLGVHSVPVPGAGAGPAPEAPASESSGSWASIRGDGASGASPASRGGLADVEAHLRRLDDDVCFHHRVVASVPVRASARRVWAVLSDFPRLSEIIPCLETCDLVQRPPGAPEGGGRARLRMSAGTSWGYGRLLTEFTADVLEKPPFEMQFRLVQGELDSLQGKWLVEPGQEEGEPLSLRFALEMRVPRKLDRYSGPDSDILQPLLERFSFSEVPKALAAVRDEAEAATSAAAAASAGAPPSDAPLPPEAAPGADRGAPSPGADRTPLPLLLQDLELVGLELREFMGLRRLQQMPTRADLRAAGRQDLVKAVEGHGGFFRVADALGLRGSRAQERPRGYWQDLGNVRREVRAFQQENLLDPGVLPAHGQFTAAARSDMARMMRKHWGGQEALAATLGLRSPKGPGAKERKALWERHLEQTRAYTQAEQDSLWPIASETFIGSFDDAEDGLEDLGGLGGVAD